MDGAASVEGVEGAADQDMIRAWSDRHTGLNFFSGFGFLVVILRLPLC
jgi:hypothetical protein